VSTPGKLIQFSEPSTIDECHASVVISRGKKKPLCEVEKIKVPWKSVDGEAKGKLEITEISTADLDDLCVKYTFDKSVEAGKKPALEKELKTCKQAIETAFETLLAEMNTK